MAKLKQPKDTLLTIKYSPDKEDIIENPPRFTWMPEQETDITYRIQISDNEAFQENGTRTYENIPYNFFVPNQILEPGNYYWRYTIDRESMEYSEIRTFTVGEDLPCTPLEARTERYQHVEMSHPRIWMNQKEIGAFREELKNDNNYCGFRDFYKNSVETYVKEEFVSEPLLYPNNKKEVSLWRENYTQCQKALCYIRSLAVAGVILEDSELKEKSKSALLQMAGWDIKGTTSRNYNDECAFRVTYALAFGYDWLYSELTEDEKSFVLRSLYLRTKEVAEHIIIRSRIHFSLYDSHAVRSLSSVLTPCCIAMLGEKQEAKEWLDYTIEYFNVIYTPWGKEDGGWAEGPLYWTTGMAFVIEALNTIKSFLGIDIYKRPFFQKTGDFPLYCNPPYTYRASFGDQSNLGKYPGHKTAFNMRQFAGVTGNGEYNKYYETIFEREPEIDNDFFNSGWWDFSFDEMVYCHDYSNAEIITPKEPDRVKWFRDIGWVAVNINYSKPKEHIFLLTKSSPYGSVSHSHGDQNDFVLFAYGEPLAARSGYYIGFNTSMHKNWRRQTKSHNLVLFNGIGQYAGMDKTLQLSATGEIVDVKEEKNQIYIKENATEAYRIQVPELKDYTREIYCIDNSYFVIVDTAKLDKAVEMEWLLHGISPFEISTDKFLLRGEKAVLDGKFVYCAAGIDDVDQTDKFDGVAQDEIKGLQKQWHLSMKTGKKENHCIVTLLVPSKKNKEKMVIPIIDDQGHDIYIYFNYDGNVFSLKVDGRNRF